MDDSLFILVADDLADLQVLVDAKGYQLLYSRRFGEISTDTTADPPDKYGEILRTTPGAIGIAKR